MKMRAATVACLVLLLFLVGCEQVDPHRLHPPSWAQGEWGDSSYPDLLSYTISENTVVQHSGNVSLDYDEMLLASDVHVTEVITSDVYSFTYVVEQQGVTADMTMEFARVDANNITLTIRMDGISIGPSPLQRL